MVNKEAQSSLSKAHSKLGDAFELDVDDFPGLVINTSYYAMHHAAAAVLQQAYGKAPIRLNEVVKAFATYLSDERPTAHKHGMALNRAFDARVAEDYGTVEPADTSEAEEIRDDAKRFVDFCTTIVNADARPQALS